MHKHLVFHRKTSPNQKQTKTAVRPWKVAFMTFSHGTKRNESFASFSHGTWRQMWFKKRQPKALSLCITHSVIKIYFFHFFCDCLTLICSNDVSYLIVKWAPSNFAFVTALKNYILLLTLESFCLSHRIG